MIQLVFLYDKLMTAKEQQFVGIPFEFLSFAQISGRMFWWNDTRSKRLCLVPPNTYKHHRLNTIYGSLWKVEDFEWSKNKLYSYYNNMSCYTGNNCYQDYMAPFEVSAIPIKFNALSDLQKQNYDRGTPIQALTFGVNLLNEEMQRWYRAYYHRKKNIDKESFIQLVNERRNNNGLE